MANPITHPIKVLVRDYSWVHLSLGLLGNLAFFIGSVLFLPSLESWQIIGVWLFIVGSLFMLIGATGQFLVNVFDPE